MGWLVGIVILILLVASRGFRKLALIFVAISAVLGGFLYLRNEHEERQALTRISPSDLVLENLYLKPDYGSYKLTGRVTNRSARYELEELNIIVTMKDCKAGSTPPVCVAIGEAGRSLYLNIPAGQARDFDEGIYFSGPVKPQGQLSWDFRIESIKAQ